MNVTPRKTSAMIGDSVKLMRAAGRQVVYDAEHFFDTFRSTATTHSRRCAPAEEAGASVLCLCDTNGGTMPEQIEEAVEAVRKQSSVKVGIHTHNDASLAVANALAAVRAGADHAQGTMNGVGERCGNMDLIPLVANLRLKYGLDCLQPDSLKHLTEASRYVYETANMNLISGQPYVGSSAFAHKGGMHVQAVQKDATTYEHVDPEAVGNSRRILISELSGVSNIATKAGKKFELENDKATLKNMLERVKTLENEGYQFEAAEASFELLVRKEIGRYRKFIELDHYRVIVLKVANGEAIAEATVKVHVDGVTEHCVAEGDGPINSLDAALRRALAPPLPGDRAGASDGLQGPRDQLARGDGRERARHHRVQAGRRGWQQGNLRHDRREHRTSSTPSWQALVDAVRVSPHPRDGAGAAGGGGAASDGSAPVARELLR
jgi:2-isopropylmalate synthase